jgi:hypothetical protein
MRASIQPSCPSIYLGQEFVMQITIAEVPSEMRWISAQIAGKVRATQKETESALLKLVAQSLGGHQQAPYFGHVMSGSRMIDSDIKIPKTYCLTVKADGIPPSYEGKGVSISYELRIVSQIGQQISQPTIIPIRFISPYRSHSVLEKTQNTATFSITSVEAQTVPSPVALVSPFPPEEERPIEFFSIKQEDLLVASLRLKLSAFAGNEFSGVIDMRDTDLGVESATVKVTRTESFPDDVIETSTVDSKEIKLKGIIMRRFSLHIPFSSPAEFSTDLFECKYNAVFHFMSSESSWTWAAPLQVLPPQLSLSMPRQIIQ